MPRTEGTLGQHVTPFLAADGITKPSLADICWNAQGVVLHNLAQLQLWHSNVLWHRRWLRDKLNTQLCTPTPGLLPPIFQQNILHSLGGELGASIVSGD